MKSGFFYEEIIYQKSVDSRSYFSDINLYLEIKDEEHELIFIPSLQENVWEHLA